MAFIDRIKEVSSIQYSDFVAFEVEGHIVGRIPKAYLPSLSQLSVLSINDKRITLSDELHELPVAERSRHFNEALREFQSQTTGMMHSKWWGEHYRADTGWGSKPLLLIERAAAKLFGINGYGVHLNGYVQKPNGLHLWVATRAADKQTDPSKLDQIAAGGLAAELTPAEGMAKEAQEEANFSADELALIRPTGVINYTTASRLGSRSDCLFVYDALLPEHFLPENTDGEVERFILMPIQDVMEIVRDSQDFKFNCSLVVIDFLIRHGYIAPEHPDYEKLCMGLRQKHIHP